MMHRLLLTTFSQFLPFCWFSSNMSGLGICSINRFNFVSFMGSCGGMFIGLCRVALTAII